MPPSTTVITGQLRQMVYYQLDNNLLSNALFLSERLAACDKSGESAYLTSLCHLRMGDNRSALEHSRTYAARNGAHLGCAYVYAQACLAIGEYKDGITSLERCRPLWSIRSSMGKHTPTRRDANPDAAAVNCLLGKLYFEVGDIRLAIKCFEDSLKTNPFMWDAFTALCDLGCTIRVPNTFKVNLEMEEMLRSLANQQDTESSRTFRDGNSAATVDHAQKTSTRSGPVTADGGDPFNNVSGRGFTSGIFGTLSQSQRFNEGQPATMNLAGGHTSLGTPDLPIDASMHVHGGREPGVVSANSLDQPPHAPMRRNRTLQNGSGEHQIDAPPRMSRAVSNKRSTKQELTHDILGEPTTNVRSHAPTAVGGERKRTVSGQTIHPRQQQLEDPGAPQRRSVRLLNQFTTMTRPSSSKLGNSNLGIPGAREPREVRKTRPPISKMLRPNPTASTVGRVVSGNRNTVEGGGDTDGKDHRSHQLNHSHAVPVPSRSQQSQHVDVARQDAEAIEWLLELFKKMGFAYYKLANYKCEEALQIFKTLPQAQQDTPWVMAQRGRTYYEQAEYKDAEVWFRRLRTIAPTRFQDMEIYSTILWHLKKEAELSFLAHELIDSDWQSPQAWCAIGNAWSLARDHEQALKCFKRATQVNPKFAYAYTLQGHEHIANEEFDKALSAYRQGVGADKRHYNAYYGLGRVYEKLGDLDKAFHHYAAASSINPTNAVLIMCMGTILEKQKQPKQALKYYTRATELNSNSALTRYKRAKALMSLGEFHVALQELMVLKDMAPDEAMVHYLLGRLYRGLREKGNAVKHFTIALNLDPKASAQIKEAMESLEVDGLDDDMEGDSMMG